MSGLGEKIDVLDFLIAVFIEHEKEIDRLVDRLEKAVAAAERLP